MSSGSLAALLTVSASTVPVSTVPLSTGPTSGVPAPDTSLAHTLSQAILPLLPPLSLGALLGFAAGYAVRVVGKIALLIAGLLFVAIQLLSYFGLVSVNWLRLEALSGPWLQDSGKPSGPGCRVC